MSEDKEKYRIWTDKELMETEFPPDEAREYRQGYIDGYWDALEHFVSLQTTGCRDYRVAFNMLWDFWDGALSDWAHGEDECDPPRPPVRMHPGYRARKNRQMVFARAKGRCQICKRPIGDGKWEIDHIIPLSKGGDDTPDNWQLAHPSCNRAKGGG
jgi:5-methylcytosine-specific restriction endonuclease McrA